MSKENNTQAAASTSTKATYKYHEKVGQVHVSKSHKATLVTMSNATNTPQKELVEFMIDNFKENGLKELMAQKQKEMNEALGLETEAPKKSTTNKRSTAGNKASGSKATATSSK